MEFSNIINHCPALSFPRGWVGVQLVSLVLVLVFITAGRSWRAQAGDGRDETKSLGRRNDSSKDTEREATFVRLPAEWGMKTVMSGRIILRFKGMECGCPGLCSLLCFAIWETQRRLDSAVLACGGSLSGWLAYIVWDSDYCFFLRFWGTSKFTLRGSGSLGCAMHKREDMLGGKG